MPRAVLLGAALIGIASGMGASSQIVRQEAVLDQPLVDTLRDPIIPTTIESESIIVSVNTIARVANVAIQNPYGETMHIFARYDAALDSTMGSYQPGARVFLNLSRIPGPLTIMAVDSVRTI